MFKNKKGNIYKTFVIIGGILIFVIGGLLLARTVTSGNADGVITDAIVMVVGVGAIVLAAKFM